MCFLGGERVNAFTRSLVALCPSGDLLLFAKHLFVAARVAWHGLQSSRGEHNRLGLSGGFREKLRASNRDGRTTMEAKFAE
jgi:hypothetical protein